MTEESRQTKTNGLIYEYNGIRRGKDNGESEVLRDPQDKML